MNRKLYILSDTFQPNTAPVNRFLAFAKGYGELGFNVNVVLVCPNKEKSKVEEEYENVSFIYLWEGIKTNNKYLKFLITRLFLISFIFKLKKNDIVVTYGMTHFIWIFRLKRNIKLYHERTEFPEVVGRSYSIIGEIKHNLYLRTCKKLDGLFVISPSLNEYFTNIVGVNKEKVHTINMIVDLSRFDNLDIQSKSNSIAYCGTVSEKKDGISYLLKSFAIVTQKYHDIKLDVIGGFENKETEENVIKLINALNIKDKVNLFGPVSAAEMPLLLSRAKILALSRPDNKQAQYGFPTKLGEYLMTGNPVVITKVGDFEKYLTDKVDVVFSKAEDIDDFSKQLLWTLDNYKQAIDIGMKGKRIAMNSFNYKTESQKVIKIIFENY